MRTFFYILFLVILSRLMAQDSTLSDSLVALEVDSSELRIAEYEKMIRENQRRSLEDSIKKQQLLEQINALHARDQKKQKAILEQIQDIESKDSVRNAERKQKVLELKRSSKGYAVAPFSDTLFMVYLKIGPVLPEERASSTAKKIQLLYDKSDFLADSMQVMTMEGTTDIVYRDMIVMSVTEWDALWWDESKDDLAKQYKAIITKAILEEQKANSLKNILMRSGLALLVVVLAIGLVLILNMLFAKVNLWFYERRDSLFKGIKIRDYEILPTYRELQLVLGLVRILKYVVFIVVCYLALPLVFSLFPFTKGWAETLFGWIWMPAKEVLLAIWDYLPNLFSIGVIYLITRYSIKFFRFLSTEVRDGHLSLPGFHPDWALPTFNILRFFLYAFMFVVIFPYLPGSDSPIFQGVSVFLGILFSLGSSTAIANAVSGLVITYMRPYSIGDRVKIGTITGDVVEKSLLVTRIKTTKNEYITVPNASILTGHTINYSTAAATEEGLVLHTEVTIGYDVSWRQVHELLISAAKKTSGVNAGKDPFVFQKSLDDFYVCYELNAYSNEPGRMAGIYSELHQNIQDAFNEAGVEIMSPHYRAVRDGEDPAMP